MNNDPTSNIPPESFETREGRTTLGLQGAFLGLSMAAAMGSMAFDGFDDLWPTDYMRRARSQPTERERTPAEEKRYNMRKAQKAARRKNRK